MQIINDFSHIVGKCQLGAGNRQCKYLTKKAGSYGCDKHSVFPSVFDKEDKLADGDNCDGYNMKKTEPISYK